MSIAYTLNVYFKKCVFYEFHPGVDLKIIVFQVPLYLAQTTIIDDFCASASANFRSHFRYGFPSDRFLDFKTAPGH